MRSGALLDRLRAARPTIRGGVFVAGGVVGMVAAYASGWSALLAVALFLLGAVVAALVVVVLAPSDVQVERRIDPGIALQREPVRVRLILRGSAAGALEWSEQLPHSVAVTGHVSGRLPALRPGRPATLLEYEVRGRVRGEVPIGPLRVHRTDPLRLVVSSRRVGPTDRVIVLPRLSDVEAPTSLRRSDPDAGAGSVLGAIGDQRDLVAREYRSGDPLRTVDWRATAHRGELMVRTESAVPTAATGLVLDTRQAAWPSAALFEAAVEHAASLVAELGSRQAPVRVVAGRRQAPSSTAEAGLVRLALVGRGSAHPHPPEAAALAATGDVQVVHLITGTGETQSLRRLAPPPRGADGLITVVTGDVGTAAPEAARGWRVRVLAVERDPRAR
ncbi:DUF58 domain-containing protein [Amnibacterium endophyticum]|uniref:DUF58 domain-containing protein n=1 Tax=Amnibacterium endophyticum TaxID=2109337 RepID=A0ABW4LC10_9MICO